MALGAYSIVRYSNNLNDQRINLGVVVWHPVEGFAYRFSPSLDRVRAIDPRVRTTPLKAQLKIIGERLQPRATADRRVLAELSQWFKEGLEVTEPYPARIHSVNETLDHLYQMLISPVPEIFRASSQRQFEGKFRKVLAKTLEAVAPNATLEEMGEQSVNGVRVNVGIQTTIRRRRALWRALSLQAVDRPEDQIARAKATAMDIVAVRSIQEFRRVRQIVALEPPKPKASQRFNESVAWLRHEQADVLQVPDRESLGYLVREKLQAL